MSKNGSSRARLGARVQEVGVEFNLWSDKASRASVSLLNEDGWEVWDEPMTRDPEEPGIFCARLENAEAGSLYKFKLDGVAVGDPYARALPFGPNGPARVLENLPKPAHAKRGIDLESGELIYELHVGSFTAEGTFRSAAQRLPALRAFGISVIELMPIAAFPGSHGWGYDGVALFAPFAGYGTTEELVSFIDAAHGCGLSVVLDVVFNHLGPDGNHLPAYSDRYFDPARKNAWGAAPALQDAPFRRLITDCARYWLEEIGFDGLRLDAAHELEPGGHPHIVQEIAKVAASCTPRAIIIAEDDRNDPDALFAHGVDAVWSDDFHHSVHVLLTREKDGYYAGYEGSLSELARVIERGQLYEGQIFEPSGKPRGKPATGVARHRLIYALQNHDQIGNRALGERLTDLTQAELFLAATVLLFFAPATPLLFMGQAWGTKTPFLYFTDHAEPLGTEITKGRREEFAHFGAFRDGSAQVPDPQSPNTFTKSKLDWSELEVRAHADIFELTRSIARLRGEDRVLNGAGEVQAGVEGDLLWVLRSNEAGQRLLLFNVGEPRELAKVAGIVAKDCQLILSTHGDLRHSQAFQLPARNATVFSVMAPGRRSRSA